MVGIVAIVLKTFSNQSMASFAINKSVTWKSAKLFKCKMENLLSTCYRFHLISQQKMTQVEQVSLSQMDRWIKSVW